MSFAPDIVGVTSQALPPALTRARGGAFYLHGEDLFLKEAAVKALIAAHIDEATRDFNLDSLRGTDVDAETLASILATPPMMAEWRVVVLRETEGLASSKHARDTLQAIAKSPPPGLALIMSCTVPQGSKAKFYSELAKASQSVEFAAFTEADVPGWIMERARTVHSVEFSVDAAQALGAAIGTDLGVLAKELEKLSEFVGERATVTVADVEAAGTHLPTQDRWRWFDLVGDRRFSDAIDGLHVLLGQGESGVGLVIGLTTQFLRLGVASEGGSRELEGVLPPHQRWLASRIGTQAKRWPRREIEASLEGLLRADRLLKSSPHTDLHFLEEWLLALWARAEVA
jgi:DNA polymerase III subunit delta